jgi:serine O-acetyltransferase
MMGLLARLREDIQTVKDRDPAARNGMLEILLTTPGLHAQWAHRLAHALWLRHVPLVPRLISHYTRFLTGIEIHPGATIGRRFFIDHGMGIVIGETAEIGDDVSLFQGVTLGGTGKETGKRHPTLKDRVTVGVGAHILGAVTIGEGARVGGGAVVLRDVPPHTTAVGVPAHTTRLQPVDAAEGGRRVQRIADPAQEQIDALRRQVADLTARLAALEDHHPVLPGSHVISGHKRSRAPEPTPASASDCN